MTDIKIILKAADAGSRAEDIAAAAGVSLSKVYSVLRVHRPGRPRALYRSLKSGRRRRIEEMLRLGHEPARVAKVLDVSRAYVYRIQAGFR